MLLKDTAHLTTAPDLQPGHGVTTAEIHPAPPANAPPEGDEHLKLLLMQLQLQQEQQAQMMQMMASMMARMSTTTAPPPPSTPPAVPPISAVPIAVPRPAATPATRMAARGIKKFEQTSSYVPHPPPASPGPPAWRPCGPSTKAGSSGQQQYSRTTVQTNGEERECSTVTGGPSGQHDCNYRV